MSVLYINRIIVQYWIMSQDVRKILAQNIKRLREAKKNNREEVSLILGLDNSYISKLEHCRINPTLEKLIKLAEYFEVELIDLFKE